MKYNYEFGQRWPAWVPRGSISWLMGRIHVYAPESEIREEFTKRRGTATDKQLEVIIRYALACQADHQKLCRDFRL